MKSEERHRLQETELEKLGRRAQDFWESFVKDYAKILMIGVGAVCLIAVIVIWWLGSRATSEAERWREVLSASFDNDPARSIEQFALTANKYPDHPAGQWAALMEAERALSQGIQTARTNRKTSISELVQAREAFAKLSESKSDLIQERRLFGLTRCLETLAGVDVSEEKDGENVEGVGVSIAAYEQFLQRYPDSIFASLAENRISALKAGRAEDFYAWFREQNPNPEDLEMPQDGPSPGSLPPGHPGSLPPGHPPISSGQPPLGPGFPEQPVSEDAMMQELEAIVRGAKGQADEEKAPDFPVTEEPPKGPSLTPPKAEESKPEAGENDQ